MLYVLTEMLRFSDLGFQLGVFIYIVPNLNGFDMLYVLTEMLRFSDLGFQLGFSHLHCSESELFWHVVRFDRNGAFFSFGFPVRVFPFTLLRI